MGGHGRADREVDGGDSPGLERADDDEAPLFVLTRHLGQGGMGDVLLAQDRIGRQVALKVIRPSLVTDPEHLEALRREAGIMGRVHSPRLARVLTFFGPGQLPRKTVAVDSTLDASWIDRVHESAVLVMEHIVGTTLRKTLEPGRLSMSRALATACLLAKALNDLHRNVPQVVHGDLKPENIMLCRGRHRLKVLDMGLARYGRRDVASDKHGGRARMPSQEDLDLGPGDSWVPAGLTPRYAAPEQLRLRDVGWPADLWAFGCVLFECLTGHPPFRAGQLEELCDQILDADPPLEELPEATPPRVRTLLARCLSRRPEARPTASEAFHLLRPWVVNRAGAHSNLPPTSRRMPIGREALLPRLIRELRSRRSAVVCLHGLPGVGKRQMAHAAAARLARLKSPRRPWLVCRLDLSPLPRDAVAAEIAVQVLTQLRSIRRLGERVPRDVTSGEALAALGGFLGRRRTILLLEGIHRAPKGVAALVGSLLDQAPETTFLVTSLTPPTLLDVALFPVPSLSVADPAGSVAAIERCGAARLFLEVARSTPGGAALAMTATTAPVIARICRAVDGLPQAIRLIAPHVDTLPLEEIERRLQELLRLPLEGAAPGFAHLGEPLSLDAALALALEDLTAGERTLLARASIFQDSFTLAAAEHVCRDPEVRGEGQGADQTLEHGRTLVTVGGAPLVEAVRGLVRRQLLIRSGSRYAQVQAVQRLATHLIDEKERQWLRIRFLAWFGELVDQGQPERLPVACEAGADWCDAIEADHANVRQALRLTAENPQGAPRLASFIRALEHFWWLRGTVADAWTWCELALARLDELPDALSRIRLLSAAGATALRARRFEDAERCYRLGMDEAEAAQMTLAQASLTSNSAMLAFMRGEMEASEALATQAVELYRLAGRPELDIADRLNLAAVRKHAGDLAVSETMFMEALNRMGDAPGTGRWFAEQNLGELAVSRGDHAMALLRFRRAWRGHRRINRYEELRALLGIGIALCLSGRPTQGCRRILAAEPLFRATRSFTRAWVDKWLPIALRAAAGERTSSGPETR